MTRQLARAIHPAPIIPADRRVWLLTKTCGRKPHKPVVGWCADGKVYHWHPQPLPKPTKPKPDHENSLHATLPHDKVKHVQRST